MFGFCSESVWIWLQIEVPGTIKVPGLWEMLKETTRERKKREGYFAVTVIMISVPPPGFAVYMIMI